MDLKIIPAHMVLQGEPRCWYPDFATAQSCRDHWDANVDRLHTVAFESVAAHFRTPKGPAQLGECYAVVRRAEA